MWVPAYFSRIDAEYLKRNEESPLLNKRPSKYAREFYYGIQPLDKPHSISYFEESIEAMGGADQLLYASDYPHWDYDPPNSVTEIPFLSESEQSKILGKNAQEVFGL